MKELPNHLMIDLETLDVRPTSVILSLGAVLFNQKQGVFDTLQLDFDLQEQFDIGRSISMDTLRWWMTQSKQSQKIFDKEGSKVSIATIPGELSKFTLGQNKKTLRVWSNGTDFDIGMVNNVFSQNNFTNKLWMFYNVTDYRTFGYITGFKKPVGKAAHDALADATHQAECILKFMRRKG